MSPGAIIGGKYRVVSLLGRGGMGSVWRAIHTELDAPVAIKLIEADIGNNPEALARFQREAKAAAVLRSPHVVQVLDHGVDAVTGRPFIAMELMEGMSLADRLTQQGRLSPPELSKIIQQVARAISRAHELGIVHRDLKPDNIFLVHNEDEEVAKVLDFGIAKATFGSGLPGMAATQTGAVMGTPYYMSPEQISGAKVDSRTDIWALGVIACECITGRRPFAAETLGGLVLQICTAPRQLPSRLSQVPTGFDTWFERATARDPNARFQSARELSDQLRLVCAGNAPAAMSLPTMAASNSWQEPALPELAHSDVGLSRTSTVLHGKRQGLGVLGWVIGFGAAAVLTGLGAWYFGGLRADTGPGVSGSSAAMQAASVPAAAITPAPTAQNPEPQVVAVPDAPVANDPSIEPQPLDTPDAYATPEPAARALPRPRTQRTPRVQRSPDPAAKAESAAPPPPPSPAPAKAPPRSPGIDDLLDDRL